MQYFGETLTYLFGGAGIIWAIVERKKRRAELKKTQADALTGMQTAYDTFVEDMNARNKESSELIILLKKDYVDLKCKHEVLKNESQTIQVNLLEMKIKLAEETNKYKILKEDYEILQLNYDKLKRDYENLKIQVNKTY